MTVLDEIIVGVREDLAERERAVPAARLAEQVAGAPAPRDPMPAFTAPGVSVLAEVKRASPSRGDLAQIADPAALAARYAAGGAAAISVLTERRRFRGSLDDLVSVRAAVEVPVLRKDFIVTDYQLIEARAAGADLALLIVAALDDAQLRDLHATAVELGLTPLVEVHDEAEIERAVAVGARLVGVNNRNLKTLAVDPATFARLAPLVPEGVCRVNESGITGPADVAASRAAGADVVLVGEALVTGDDPAAAVQAMIDAGR
ncbi:indole-3-glycerol-phosphate synthase [Enemella evansiae]|uniref:Indole-3-glycerol phosphate synthase n=1 Tax=Enemella evansiae TaxID=2016499 RepID=A0A255GMR1_9ACTN|nr:indole-3-glycerol phosphate synthase TrpC [Enemella evansiae]OYN99042.1 indole-3-glycerol-phosphate synthase [Enemella evansiae]OYO00016.1 indole-3-glycerol-phosphate synthase [Enemella evansiae]OYO14284.1 indole-3-glycerol-phosphate synthase [Enemella evansiae]